MSKQKPVFSVLMSVYAKDNSDYLNDAIKSIWTDQYKKPNEIVIVKDGPLKRKLIDILSNWQKNCPVLRIVSLEKNSGLAKALNKGLSECNYSLVARMDADDISLPQRFSEQVKFFEQFPETDICGSWCMEIDENNKVLESRRVPIKDPEIKKLIWSCPINHPTVMFKKNKILQLGGYRHEAGNRQEDYDLWIRSAFAGLKFSNINQSLLLYRVVKNSFKKNDIGVGFNRFLIGLKAVKKFDPSFKAFLGITFPIWRALLPVFLSKQIIKLARKLDPRSV
jgi:glycosyltransferase involved in cell wall biosynthesis